MISLRRDGGCEGELRAPLLTSFNMCVCGCAEGHLEQKDKDEVVRVCML